MDLFDNYIGLVLLAIIVITLIDTFSSLFSRHYRINYAYFSILSLFGYISIAYEALLKKGWASSLIIVFIAGVFDATIGWEISKGLKAYLGKNREKILEKTSLPQRLLQCTLFSLFCGYISYLISTL